MATTHTISGNNFHGNYSIKFRGPAEGFILSPAQQRRYGKKLCGVAGCACGGGYGTREDKNGARIIQSGFENLQLVPRNSQLY